MDAPERSNIAVSASIASIATVADPGPAVLSARPTRGGDSRSPAVVAAQSSGATSSSSGSSRYESQKRRDWNTFLQYLKNQKPPLTLARCSGAHVIEFLKYLDQFGKTKVHVTGCPYFGNPNTPAPCACPLKQAWGSLDALIGRLRAAYEENGGRPESNPFGAKVVRIYLREVREGQAKARGIRYEKKKKKRKRRGSLQKAGGCGSGGGGINGDTPPQTFSAHDGAPDSGGGGRIGPTSAGPALAVATIPFPNSTGDCIILQSQIISKGKQCPLGPGPPIFSLSSHPIVDHYEMVIEAHVPKSHRSIHWHHIIFQVKLHVHVL